MASQVLSGTSNVSYTNNTGQNVRVVINYMAGVSSQISLSWAGVSASSTSVAAIGRNLAFNNGLFGSNGSLATNNAASSEGSEGTNLALPTEIMLSAGQTFSATCGAYNIVIIPEGG